MARSLARDGSKGGDGAFGRDVNGHIRSCTLANYFIWLLFARTRSYTSSIAAMNDPFFCQNGGKSPCFLMSSAGTRAGGGEACGGRRWAPAQNSRTLVALDAFW